MKKVKWGILSTAKIGLEHVIPAMENCKYAEVVAISSRSSEKSIEMSKKYRIPFCYNSYSELLEDSEVEAIYNPLPNHLHVPWTIKALKAGKHVLCEKPIALSESESVMLLKEIKKKSHLKMMEAFMYRHHPQWIKTKKMVDEGKIGQLKTIHSFFSYNNRDAGNVRNIQGTGGGGLMDIGCYCISLSRFIFGAEPSRVLGILEKDPDFEVDRLVSGILDFGEGTASFTCGTQIEPYQRVIVYGTEGYIEIDIPFNAPKDCPCNIWLFKNSKKTKITFDICNQYTIQMDLFSLSVLNDTNVPTSLEDSVLNMRVIDSIFSSADNNRWINLI